ncbi:MAG TPA: hypothetical protein VL572_09480 [Pyrinomonadaceae bacterium]|nr:hypothetical protein [Pyrinomonadaceae bacterium]
MKKILLATLISLFSLSAMAQTPGPETAVKEANPTDVATLDAIMKAVYEVISGDAGQKRDWDRFRSLFHKDAKLIPSGKNPQTGVQGARFLTPEEYVTRSGPNLEKNGFHERELARHVDQYGNIAQVFSTYVSFHKKDDKDPFMRGINSFQLMNDGKRWWVINIYWQAETPETPIPKEYLKSKN